jgi:hypothetical protein
MHRFAIGILNARAQDAVSATIQHLARHPLGLRLPSHDPKFPAPAKTPTSPNGPGGLERIRPGTT